MPASRSRLRALVVGVSAFALVAVATGGTLAASANPPTLYACFNTSGQVAMATTPQCKLAGGGQLASWGTAPVPGPTGPQGATGVQGPTGPVGPTGAPYAPTLVKWSFTAPECAAGNPICPVTSATTFPAGSRLTPVSGQIDGVFGSGVATCASANLKVQAGNGAILFDATFNPTGGFPVAMDALSAYTTPADAPLRAFMTLCGNAGSLKPGATGSVVLQVEYPAVAIP